MLNPLTKVDSLETDDPQYASVEKYQHTHPAVGTAGEIRGYGCSTSGLGLISLCRRIPPERMFYALGQCVA